MRVTLQRPKPSGLSILHTSFPHITSVRDSLVFDLYRDSGKSSAFWTTYYERFYGLRRVELSRFDYAMNGAGAGATLGMFVGGMASGLGLWDERTSWYLAGAATALGAILGGTTGVPDDPGARVRFRWEPLGDEAAPREH
jgi:hypothetical protein